MYNIAIIGAGQLGSRHLQSIKASRHKCNIWVIDSSPESLEKCKKIYSETQVTSNVNNCVFEKSIEALPDAIDFLLIATGSKPRYSLFEKITSSVSVRNVIFEKVLFQKINEYYKVADILSRNDINAWVNCPRRLYSLYENLKKSLSGKTIKMNVTGGNWGLACNAIHYIDIFSFLTGKIDYSINIGGLKNIIDSKRNGYKELIGSIECDFGDNYILTLSSSNYPYRHLVTISTDDKIYIIDNSAKKCTIISNVHDYSSFDFEIPYQSQLTAGVLDNILDNRKPYLTTYKESMALHLPFINALTGYFALNSYENNSCPIT